MKKYVLFLVVSVIAINIRAAEPDSLNKGSIIISGEMRPRFELRKGYKTLIYDSLVPASFVSQRSRLNFDFKNHYLRFYVSLQDIRIWGEDASTSDLKYPGLFESWAEVNLCSKWKIRAGRQVLSYDNERLYSAGNWKQAARTHDAFRLVYQNDKLVMEQVIAFNQTKENSSGTGYSPAFSNYKFLAVIFFKYKISDELSITLLNSAEGFQDIKRAENMYLRITPGGRLEYKKDKLYATVASWYQCGKTDSLYKIHSWYLHAEAKYEAIKNLFVTGGVEILSGNINGQGTTLNRAFVTLYGSGHTFMGYMDYFTSFPGDTKKDGLVNPYLYLQYKAGKVNLKLNNHLFYLQSDSQQLDKYLGFETDLVASYKICDYATAEAGFCALSPTESLKTIRGVDSPASFQHFCYVMLTVNPVLFSTEKK